MLHLPRPAARARRHSRPSRFCRHCAPRGGHRRARPRSGAAPLPRERLPRKGGLRRSQAPGLLRNRAERDARRTNHAVLGPDRRRSRDQRIFVALPLANLHVSRAFAGAQGKAVGGDQLAGREPGLEPRRIAAITGGFGLSEVEGEHRYSAPPLLPEDFGHSIETSQRDGGIGGLRRHAIIRPAQDRMALVQPAPRRASRAGDALVAAPGERRLGAEIRAARLLQHIAAEGRAVANLDRGSLQAGLGQHRRVLANEGVRADLAQRGAGADDDLLPVSLNGVERGKPPDIDDPGRRRNTQPHPVQDLRSAGDDGCVRSLQHRYGTSRIQCDFVSKVAHQVRSMRCPASRTAAVICG
jgi:hypothetical protein